MRIYVSSLGCKLNQSEMDDLAARLAQNGHQIVASAGEADLCILNTCAVTHVAAQKSRQALGRLHHDNPSARLVATGCYADLSPAELSALPGVGAGGRKPAEGAAGRAAGPCGRGSRRANLPPAPAPGPWSRSRMAATMPAPTASSGWRGDRSAAGHPTRSWPTCRPASRPATRRWC